MKSIVNFTTHTTPLGDLTLAATEAGLCGLYFADHKPAPDRSGWKRDDGALFDDARLWLDAWFEGEKPRRLPAHEIVSGTPFQKSVWEALRAIPSGETTTYGELAARVSSPKAVRAVGAAVGRNPLSILIPCHRVLGSDGSLTGYAGGLVRKQRLLALEGVNLA